MLFNSKARGRQIAVALVLIVTALATAGCRPGGVPFGVTPPPYAWYERPAITTDGAGGAIVFYAVQEFFYFGGRQFYLQRVDKEGNFLWGDDGVLVGKGYRFSGNALGIVSDESGGAIVVRKATFKRGTAEETPKRRTGEETDGIHVARVSPHGEILWQRVFRRAEEDAMLSRLMRLLVTSDGSGGVIVGMPYSRYGLIAQRIDSQGQFLWGKSGITISRPWQGPAKGPGIGGGVAAFDGVISEKGAVIFVWEELDGTILAQKISSEGEALWPEEGMQVDLSEDSAPQVIGDGSGGAIIAWIKGLAYANGFLHPWEVRAQRVDPQGNLLWQQGGIPVGVEKEQGAHRPEFYMTASGRDNAIIAYQKRGRAYLQKVDSEGNLEWGEGGVPVHKPPTLSPSMVSDNAGGVILMFCNPETLWPYLHQAQRVDAEGKVLWGQRGVSPTTISGGLCSILPDGQGGVFVAWVVWEVGPMLSYIQRIAASGEPMWGDEGILLNP